MMTKNKQSIINHYKSRIKTGKQHFDILDWADQESQFARFSVLADNLQLDGKSILDVGCGLCDLWDFLNSQKINPVYTGVDIVPEMADKAREIHPDLEIKCVDLFTETLDKEWQARKFDTVFCSGMLNLNLGNNEQFTEFAIKRMAQLSQQYLVFNLLHERTENKYPHCVYHNPEKIISITNEIGQAKLIDNYLPNDFTVIVTLK